MARYGREVLVNGAKGYLPDPTILLLCLLGVGAVLRGLHASKYGMWNSLEITGNLFNNLIGNHLTLVRTNI